MYHVEIIREGNDHWTRVETCILPSEALKAASRHVKAWLKRNYTTERAEDRTRVLDPDGKVYNGEEPRKD